MMVGLWIVLGIFGWLAGFFRAGFAEKDGYKINRVFVRPPFLVYLLCGLPRASNIPRGVIALRSLMSQLLGILILMYGIISNYLPVRHLILEMVFMLLVGSGVIGFCLLLYKRSPYIPPTPKVE